MGRTRQLEQKTSLALVEHKRKSNRFDEHKALLTTSLLIFVVVALLEHHLLGLPFWNRPSLAPCFASSDRQFKVAECLCDYWSFCHMQTGMLFYLLLSRWKASWNTKWVACMLLQGAWELFENLPSTIKRYRKHYPYDGDTILNSLGDQCFCLLGFYLGHRLGIKRTLAVLIVLEVALYVSIRESGILTIAYLFF